jgi:hypothetical protein
MSLIERALRDFVAGEVRRVVREERAGTSSPDTRQSTKERVVHEICVETPPNSRIGGITGVRIEQDPSGSSSGSDRVCRECGMPSVCSKPIRLTTG